MVDLSTHVHQLGQLFHQNLHILTSRFFSDSDDVGRELDAVLVDRLAQIVVGKTCLSIETYSVSNRRLWSCWSVSVDSNPSIVTFVILNLKSSRME